jgi:hypothetical protein
MNRTRSLLLIPLVLLMGCDLFETDDDDDNNGGDDVIDPVVTQAYLQRNFTKIPRITEAMGRVLLTLNGTPQNGVTFTPITGGVQGTVGVDLDGNGSLETTVDARVILNNPAQGIAGGGVLTVTAINAASTGGNATANITLVGTSTVTLSNGSATLFPTQGPSQITVANANLTVTPTLNNPSIVGSADFASSGTTGTAFFENNGSGGFRIRITSPDFTTFTVP